ncbi:replication initiator [Streptomyces griseofuscus]|uniref:replication initiator n=1 Tax=Streptomyces griseofuscus TaxID=146922 RepID=UPI0033F1F9A7
MFDPRCEHGRRLGCGLVHAEDDPLVGLPLCPDCYDYVGHVLWHAHAGRLWDRFTTAARRYLASAGGIPRSKLGEHLVVSFAKVAEFQRRAAVHFHAVVRLDGPDGPGSSAPAWAAEDVLLDAVEHAAALTFVTVPDSDAYGAERVSWGGQFDAHPIRPFPDGDVPSDAAVAGYVAKYVTKGAADTAGGLDYQVTSLENIRAAVVNRHVRALMGTCWRLGGLVELEHLRLRPWAHSLGYRGHILTKSRRYSTTYGALREERADHRRGGPSPWTAWTRSRNRPGATSAPATPPVRLALPSGSLKITRRVSNWAGRHGRTRRSRVSGGEGWKQPAHDAG